MKKEFAPYELALRLNKIGFDVPCMRYYSKDGSLITRLTQEKECNAPLFQQAFRWFREEFYMVGEINSYYADKKWSFNYDIVTIFKEKASDRFNTYEEAELACLDKLIEIVETKQQEQ
jgi:hypothetical protein